MKYSILTFGCRVNQADSLEIEEQLLASGGTPVPAESADVVVVNTCSVTAGSDQGARQAIRRVARQNPQARIVATGCYATRRPDELVHLPRVACVVSNHGKADVAPVALWSTGAEARHGHGDGPCGARVEPGVAGRTAYTLRVQTGCNQPCSYCIVPTTRGASRSRPIESILTQLDGAIRAGFREVALTGVHLGSYGVDLPGRVRLIDLLRRLDACTADVGFRISSLEPMDCTPGIVDLVARSGRFAPHFHLPLQHASDALLRSMRRPYTSAAYRELVATIRRRLPHAALGSDIIVGFPGETDPDVDELAGYLEASPLTHLHVFPYSDRPDTTASALPAKVAGHVIRERSRRIRAIGSRLTDRFRQSQIGSVRRGLTVDDGSLVVTGNYLKVRVPPGYARNEWVDVWITGAADAMTGEIVAQRVPGRATAARLRR